MKLNNSIKALVLGAMLGLVLADALPAASANLPRVGDKAVRLQSAGHELLVSLQCPTFVFDAGTAGGALPAKIKGSLARGETIEVSYPAQAIGTNGQLEAKLFLQWSAKEGVLRKWSEFRLQDAPAPVLLKEVILEQVDLPGEKLQLEGSGGQSYPAFWPGFFAGIEFPIAATRVEGERLMVAHRPGWTLRNGEWRQSRKAVFGVAPEGGERREFERYITAHRPKPVGLFVNYNSWWSMPMPFNETNVLALMQEFEQKLYKPYGVSFDAFCLDAGWSEPRSVWEIKKDLFPEGFSRIQSAAAKMGSHLGLWISPSACYSEALDPDWARTNVETFLNPYEADVLKKQRWCCLGGERYATAFRMQLVDLVQRYDIRQLKLDGYMLECPEPSHGHAPGNPLSAEAVAEGGIAAIAAVRQVQPEIWMETTCFGWNPSPWWLFHVNSVIGTYGDDAPRGRVPAPVYRESYTTSRDYFNLQGAALLPVPIVAQEVLGVIHQTPEPFMNDAVITVLRGHAFLPLYLNPAYLDENRWQALAQFLQWSRRNASLLEETIPILPAAWQTGKIPKFSNDEVMPREPYGYAHWKAGQGLVALRNPWIAPQTLALRLDESLGVERGAKNLEVVSLYPEPRIYGSGARFGDTLQIPLAPYETVVLSLAKKLKIRGLPQASAVVSSGVVVEKVNREFNRVEFEGESAQALGPDWTSSLTNGFKGLELKLDAEVSITAPTAELLILAEADQALPEPVVQSLLVDGKEMPLTSNSSATGWSSTGWPVKVHWLFLKAALPGGKHQVSLKLLCADTQVKLSAWVWATKPGGTLPAYPNALPSPETISLNAQPLFSPIDATSVTGLVQVHRPIPVERIDGIFLDALEPVSYVQGWGTLQKNQSVWEKPMTIAGKSFVRGLGTSSQSRIAYALDGSYRRFQSWVGADGAATTPSVTFEVWVDGRKKWESGVMRRDAAAKWTDVDVSGARSLELVIGDAGDGIASDHANWADAKLLR